MKPFVKWVGGKTQLLDILTSKIPKQFNNYYEPFVGGGALFLSIQPKKATINDINPYLCNVYKQIRNNPKKLIIELENLDKIKCDKLLFYKRREIFNNIKNKDTVDSAALFIWVNKHCFNGIYRENSSGDFNVPYNNKITGNSYDENNILNVYKLLINNKISILCGDFERACKNAKKNDFIYFDSPYILNNNKLKGMYYSYGTFDEKDHIRLANLYKSLDKKGVKMMLSNSNDKVVKKLYNDFNIETINIKRYINSVGSNRKDKEVIITNY